MLTLEQIEKSNSLSAPVELYLFEHGTDSYAYCNDSRKFLHVDGRVYEPLPINRTKIQRSSQDYKNKLDIELPSNSAIPLLFQGHLPAKHVYISVLVAQRDNPALSQESFSGEVIGCDFSNTTGTLHCAPSSGLLRRQMLRFGYQSQCNNHLYDDLCGLDITKFQKDSVVQAISENGTKLQLSYVGDSTEYYLAGLLSFDESDFRMITGVNISTREVTLISPIYGIEVGSNVKIAKGCDRSASACQGFGNFDNFYGFLTIPNTNPFGS